MDSATSLCYAQNDAEMTGARVSGPRLHFEEGLIQERGFMREKFERKT
jgi:hypothetical protein